MEGPKMQDRTQKDLDIIRQCCVKAAVDLIGHFPDKVQVEGNDGIITTTCKIADKLYQWVIEPSTVKGKVNDIKGKLGEGKSWSQRVKDECHKLQERLNLKLTDFDSDPCPFGNWNNGGASKLLDTLRLQLKYGDGASAGKPRGKPTAPPRGKGKTPAGKGLEKLAFESGYIETGWRDKPIGEGTPKLSASQYGYAVSLYRKLGVDYDPVFLNSLEPEQASAHIDELKEKL
jgi:hypothetical protein